MTQILEPLDVTGWRSRRYRAAALEFATGLAAPGVWVEAGVANGWSARRILKRLKPGATLHLFDSFQGLPEEWAGHPRGTFKSEPPQFNDARVTTHVGMFADTLPEFARVTRPVTFLHVDCDLYASTMTVLRVLGPVLAVGCVVAFDEALGSIDALEHEGRALREWGRGWREVARTDYTQLVVEVTQ